jgi:hypothetical protein
MAPKNGNHENRFLRFLTSHPLISAGIVLVGALAVTGVLAFIENINNSGIL